MKKIFAVLAIALCAAAAHADNLNAETSVQSSAGASNQGVSTTFNSYGTPMTYGSADNRFNTNQAAAVAPSFSSPAVIGTCATAGRGFAAQLVGGGASYAGPGGVDDGCDTQRDINIMVAVGASKEDIQARACLKPEIAKSMKICQKETQKVAQATGDAKVTALNTGDDIIRARLSN